MEQILEMWVVGSLVEQHENPEVFEIRDSSFEVFLLLVCCFMVMVWE